MSVHVASWAWKQKLGDPGLKLVLVKLADNADDNGFSWWKQQRLADECEMSRATVQRKLKTLTERGYIATEERSDENGLQIANGYRVLRPVPQDEAATVPHNGDAPITVKTSSSRDEEKAPKKTAKTINGTPVTAAEEDFAVAALAAFNDVSGKHFSGKEALGKIILRHREHPELTVEDHRRLVEQQFKRPWWRGDPTPSVIWGNGNVFDNALNGVGRDKKADNGGIDFSEYALPQMDLENLPETGVELL